MDKIIKEEVGRKKNDYGFQDGIPQAKDASWAKEYIQKKFKSTEVDKSKLGCIQETLGNVDKRKVEFPLEELKKAENHFNWTKFWKDFEKITSPINSEKMYNDKLIEGTLW